MTEANFTLAVQGITANILYTYRCSRCTSELQIFGEGNKSLSENLTRGNKAAIDYSIYAARIECPVCGFLVQSVYPELIGEETLNWTQWNARPNSGGVNPIDTQSLSSLVVVPSLRILSLPVGGPNTPVADAMSNKYLWFTCPRCAANFRLLTGYIKGINGAPFGDLIFTSSTDPNNTLGFGYYSIGCLTCSFRIILDQAKLDVLGLSMTTPGVLNYYTIKGIVSTPGDQPVTHADATLTRVQDFTGLAFPAGTYPDARSPVVVNPINGQTYFSFTVQAEEIAGAFYKITLSNTPGYPTNYVFRPAEGHIVRLPVFDSGGNPVTVYSSDIDAFENVPDTLSPQDAVTFKVATPATQGFSSKVDLPQYYINGYVKSTDANGAAGAGINEVTVKVYAYNNRTNQWDKLTDRNPFADSFYGGGILSAPIPSTPYAYHAVPPYDVPTNTWTDPVTFTYGSYPGFFIFYTITHPDYSDRYKLVLQEPSTVAAGATYYNPNGWTLESVAAATPMHFPFYNYDIIDAPNPGVDIPFYGTCSYRPFNPNSPNIEAYSDNGIFAGGLTAPRFAGADIKHIIQVTSTTGVLPVDIIPSTHEQNAAAPVQLFFAAKKLMKNGLALHTDTRTFSFKYNYNAGWSFLYSTTPAAIPATWTPTYGALGNLLTITGPETYYSPVLTTIFATDAGTDIVYMTGNASLKVYGDSDTYKIIENPTITPTPAKGTVKYLVPVATLSGRVTKALGIPISGVTVTASAVYPYNYFGFDKATITDSNGYFYIKNVGACAYSIFLSKSGYSFQDMSPVVLDPINGVPINSNSRTITLRPSFDVTAAQGGRGKFLSNSTVQWQVAIEKNTAGPENAHNNSTMVGASGVGVPAALGDTLWNHLVVRGERLVIPETSGLKPYIFANGDWTGGYPLDRIDFRGTSNTCNVVVTVVYDTLGGGSVAIPKAFVYFQIYGRSSGPRGCTDQTGAVTLLEVPKGTVTGDFRTLVVEGVNGVPDHLFQLNITNADLQNGTVHVSRDFFTNPNLTCV